MMTNCPIELDDDALSHLADLIDGRSTKRTATRNEIKAIAVACFKSIRDLSPGDVLEEPRVDAIGDLVIEDINRGGWTFIGEPPGIK